MTSLRALLLDCRSALRRADPAFGSSALGERLDDAILEIAKGTLPDVPVPATHAAQQVAYAWQVATRDLRFTHPDLHAQLGERVRKLLDVEVLDDPAIEIQRLQAGQSASEGAADALRRDLDELRQALADAVPGVNDNIPAAEAARLRMRKLIDAGSRANALPVPPQRVAADPSELVPTRTVLRAVAEGQRTLSREEREWCLTEGMVLSGFSKTPVQLLEEGEPALAKLILAGAHLAD